MPDVVSVAYITGLDGTLLSVWLTHLLSLCSRKTDVMEMDRLYAVPYYIAGGDTKRGTRGRGFTYCGGPLYPVLPKSRLVILVDKA